MTAERNIIYKDKERFKVRVETSREIVIGYVHVIAGQRVSDLINEETRFVPLTNVTITASDSNQESNHVPFLALNKDHIVSMSECDLDNEF